MRIGLREYYDSIKVAGVALDGDWRGRPFLLYERSERSTGGRATPWSRALGVALHGVCREEWERDTEKINRLRAFDSPDPACEWRGCHGAWKSRACDVMAAESSLGYRHKEAGMHRRSCRFREPMPERVFYAAMLASHFDRRLDWSQPPRWGTYA